MNPTNDRGSIQQMVECPICLKLRHVTHIRAAHDPKLNAQRREEGRDGTNRKRTLRNRKRYSSFM